MNHVAKGYHPHRYLLRSLQHRVLGGEGGVEVLPRESALGARLQQGRVKRKEVHSKQQAAYSGQQQKAQAVPCLCPR